MSNLRIIRNLILQGPAIEQVTTAAVAATGSRRGGGSKTRDLQQCNTTIDSIGLVVIDLSEGCHLSCHQRDQMGQLLD